MVAHVQALWREHPEGDYVGTVAIVRTDDGWYRVGYNVLEREELSRWLESDGGEAGKELAAELRDRPPGAIFSSVFVEEDGSATVHHEYSAYLREGASPN
jgi:hypothetical protein